MANKERSPVMEWRLSDIPLLRKRKVWMGNYLIKSKTTRSGWLRIVQGKEFRGK